MSWNTIRSAMGPWGIVPFGDRMPDNSLGDMNALAKAHAAARAQRLAAGPSGSLIGPPAPPAPSPPISGISPGYQDTPPAAPSAPAAPAQSAPQLPWWASGDMAKMMPGASPAPAPAAPQAPPQASPVPMPQARPADAPQAQPDTSFFMRNALLQRDPMTGQLLDPSAASSVTGPDLISKMMTYLHGKASA